MSEVLLWRELFPTGYSTQNRGTTFHYDAKKISNASARASAEKECALRQRIRDHVTAAINGTKPLYIQLTTGQKAGTIARITTLPPFGITVDNRHPASGPPSRCVINDNHWYNERGAYDVSGVAAIQGHSEKVEASVNGVVVATWHQSSDAILTSARPVLLLDYEGEEILVKNKAGSKTKPEVVLKDRFGRNVRVNDLVIVGHNRDGTLIIGKIAWLSDAKTMRIKHVGNKELVQLPNVQPEQILLLTDDIKAVLMMEKLKGL